MFSKIEKHKYCIIGKDKPFDDILDVLINVKLLSKVGFCDCINCCKWNWLYTHIVINCLNSVYCLCRLRT